MECVTLTTERLILRCPSAADVDRVLSICEDPEIVAFTTVPHPYRLEDAKAFVTEIIPAGWASGTGLAWGMYAKDQNELLGLVSLSRIESGSAELGYWLDSEVRGQGLMTEAAARVVDYAFAPTPDGLHLRRLGWEAVADNTASAGVARKLGFRWEGLRRQAADRLGTIYDLSYAGLLRSDDRLGYNPWPSRLEVG